MASSITQELDFNAILTLVAAHAQTGVGRRHLTDAGGVPTRDETRRRVALTGELDRLLEGGDRLSLAGIDEARPWLEPGVSMPVDPADLMDLLLLARKNAAVRRALRAAPDSLVHLKEMAEALPDTEELVAWVAPRLGRDGRIPDEASPELKRLRRSLVRVRQKVVSELEGVRRQHADLTTDAPLTLRRDRYCLPVKAASRSRMPGLVLDSSGSGATSFVEPFAVVELNNELADATAREQQEVFRILAEVAAAFGAIRDDLAAAVEILGGLDAVQAKWQFGRRVEGRLLDPDAATSALILKQARHPLLDARLAALRTEVLGEPLREGRGKPLVPLDFAFPDQANTLVVSGPNAGGKTVVLKTIGLMVLMAYHGIPIPVDPGSSIPWYDHLWCRIGDDQDVSADLSTFSGAMAATAALFEAAGPRSLVIYDELGSGTDPLEGAALGVSILETLTERGCHTVATTHLAAIGLAASSADGMDNAAMDYDEIQGRPTYTMRLGRPGRSRGLEIAETMGLPATVIGRSRDLLGSDHLELDRWLERLETLEGELLDRRTELERERIAVSAARARAELEEQRLDEERAAIPSRIDQERSRLQAKAKAKLDRALARLDRATEEQRHLGKRARQNVRNEALDFDEPREQPADSDPSDSLQPGAAVRIPALGAEGTLQTVKDTQARIEVEGKWLWVAVRDVEPLRSATRKPPEKSLSVAVEDPEPSELLLLGLDAEEAREQVERYLDRAHASGMTMVRIVHGHGTGTLRRVVTDILKTHPAVAGFRHPPGNRGGTGATEVTLDA